MSRTCQKVIVNHACCLHEGVADRRADEFESASQQVAAHGIGFGSVRGYVSEGSPPILNWRTANKAPEISVESSEFFSQLEKSFRVLDRSRDFQSVPHDAIVAQQPLSVAFAVAGDLFRAKSVKCFS